MEFNWEDISKKISNAADYTVKKTEKLTAMAKLEYKLANARAKLNQLYQNMGKMKFSEMTGEEISAQAYGEVYDKITTMLVTAEQIEEELSVLRNYRHCLACGAKISNDMAFCPKCGTKQEASDVEPAIALDKPEEKPEIAEEAAMQDAQA